MFVPKHVDKFLFTLAPVIILAAALAIFAVIPFGSVLPASAGIEGVEQPIQLLIAPGVDVGVIYVFALSGIAVYGVIIALAPSIVSNLLGPQWSGTEDVIRVLALVGIVGILGDATVPLFLGLGRPAIPLVTGILQMIIVATFLWLVGDAFGVAGAAAAWLPAIAASQLVCVGFAMQLLDRPFRGLAALLPAVLGVTTLGALTAYGVDSLVDGPWGLILALTTSGGVIGLSLWSLDRMLGLEILASVPKLFPQLAPLLRRLGIRA